MPSYAKQARSAAVACVVLAAAFVFGREVDSHYPIRDWLLLRYLRCAAACAAMAIACLVSGYRVVALLDGRTLRVSERLLIAFACGVLIFALGIFFAGFLGWYGPVFFFAWPALLMLLGGPGPFRVLTANTRRMARWPPRPRTLGAQALEHAGAVFIGLGLLAVYLQVLTPGNGFDARWYHLAIAEQYAVQGAIRPFREGWYLGAYPQLARWLYTWAFQMPGELFVAIRESCRPKNEARWSRTGFRKMASFRGLELWVQR